MADESESYRDVVSRRRFVELTGVAGAAALAGCDGDGNGGTPTATDSDGNMTEGGGGTPTATDSGNMEQPQYPGARHTGVTTQVPADLQFNPTNTSNLPEISQYILFERFAQYNTAKGEWEPAAIENWELADGTFEMTVRDGLTWSNGEPVTSEDVRIQLEIAIETGGRVADFVSGVEVPDDKTVVLQIEDQVNPALIESAVFTGRWLAQDRFTYQEYLDKAKNGNTDAVRGFKDNDPITCGPFSLSKRTEQAMLCEHNSDNPWSQNINFGEYSFTRIGGNNKRQQALLSLDVDSDFSVAVPARIVADFPDAVEEVRIPDVFGIGLTPNHSDKYAGDRAVRQAMAYAINRQQVVNRSLPRAKQAPEIMTGISSNAQETWLGDEKSSYRTYGVDKKMTEEATSVLEDAGYSKSDGTWVDSDGNTVELTVSVPGGWSDWVLAAETAVGHLQDFGFEATLETLASGTYWPTKNNSEFQFLANTWLHGGPTTYPYFSLRHQLWEPSLHVAKYNYEHAIDQSAIGGKEEPLTVPARNGDGEMEFVTGDKVTKLASTGNEDEINTLVKDLAWAANVDLPMIPLAEKRLQTFLTSDEWDVPVPLEEDADANVAWAPTWLPRKGKMNYKGN